MIRYYINPHSVIGQAYYLKDNMKNSVRSSADDILTLEFTMDYGEYDDLISNFSHFIVTDDLKNALESSKFEGLEFELYSSVQRTYLEDDLSSKGAKNSFMGDYWKMNCKENSIQYDISRWKSELIVSEKALDVLYDKNGFKDFDEGIHLGDEYSFISNKFLLEGDVEAFFLNKYPKIKKEIKEKRKLIMDEYHRRNI